MKNKQYKFKNGVFLARMQPLHNAHLFLVQEALKECRNVHIFLGSANKKNTLRNPFSLTFRRGLLEKALLELGNSSYDIDRITVFELPDWSYENDTAEPKIWGRYFYYNVVSRIEQKQFAMYYSDDRSIIDAWFASEVQDYITLRLYDRTSVYSGLSATKIRQALISNDKPYLENFCPSAVLTEIDTIRDYYTAVLDDPDEDFAMI